MKEEMLKQLVERTFAKLANPLEGNGVYSEIQNAIQEAYAIGERNAPPSEQPIQINSIGR